MAVTIAPPNPVQVREIDRAMLLSMLLASNLSDAVGAAFAFIAHAADEHPEVIRRSLHMPMNKPGVDGTKEFIQILNRIAR